VPIEGYDKFTPRAILCLLGSWIIHLVAGAQYAWGNMSPYIVSYFKNNGYPEVTGKQLYSVLPVVMGISTLTFPIGMQISTNYGPRYAIAIGGVFICTCVFITSVWQSPTVFFIFYAGGFGVGKGFVYPSPLKASWSHLPGRKGLVSGFIVSGLGFGAFIYGILASLIVNPENENPMPMFYDAELGKMRPEEEKPNDDVVIELVFSKEVSDRVPAMLQILVGCWVVHLIIGMLSVTEYQKKKNKVEDESADAEWKDVKENELQKFARTVPIYRIILSKEFAHIFAISLAQIFYGYYIMNSFKTYGATKISDD